MKLTTFFISRTERIDIKTINISESTFKIKEISTWTLFKILLTSAVICKQRLLHENEIVQYLQNKNSKTLIKVILESPYKLQQTPSKTTTLRQPAHFLQAVQF